MEKKNALKKYFPTMRKYWYYFLFGPFFMVLEACGEFVLPFLNANIINIGASNGDTHYILINGLYMALIAIFMLICGVVGSYFATNASARLAEDIRNKTFCKVQSFSFSDIDKFTAGSLITRITNDVSQIQSFTQSMLRGVFRSPVMIIGALIMSFILSRSIAWIIFVIIPLLALAIFIIIKIASPRYTIMQQGIDALNTDIKESVTNEKVIRSFVREDFEKEKFSKVSTALTEKSVSALKVMLFMQPVSSLAINITTLLVTWFAGRQIMIGNMEVGTLSAFITYLSQVLTALNFLANIVLLGTRAYASDKRISEVLSSSVAMDDKNAKCRDKIVKNGSIEFKNVSFKYYRENSENVLSNINLKIEPGEMVGIIGSTGSGKTSLVSLIPRLYDATDGEVLVDGVCVKDYSFGNLRAGVAMVLQKNTLFSGTIEENLRWGNENATFEEIVEATKIAQAHDFITGFVDGYKTELGQGGVNLSGGQKQRICIARALIKKPKIIILDDSTSAVDTMTDASIRQGLRLSNCTKIVIAQRISSVIDADKIVVIDGGKIVGQGTHDELMEACNEYREIYWSQNDKSEVKNG